MGYAGSVLNALRPSYVSWTGAFFCSSDMEPSSIGYSQEFTPTPPRIHRIATSIFLTFQGLRYAVGDLIWWAGMTITIIPMLHTGLKTHLINLVAALAAPFLCLSLPFGYQPKVNWLRPMCGEGGIKALWGEATVCALHNKIVPNVAVGLNLWNRTPDILSQLLDYDDKACWMSEAHHWEVPYIFQPNITEGSRYRQTKLFQIVSILQGSEYREVYDFFAFRKALDPRLQAEPVHLNVKDYNGAYPLTYALLGIGWNGESDHRDFPYVMAPNLLLDHAEVRKRNGYSTPVDGAPKSRQSIWIIQKLIEEGAVIPDSRFEEYYKFVREVHTCWTQENQEPQVLEAETTAIKVRHENSDNHYIQVMVELLFKRKILKGTTQHLPPDATPATRQKDFAELLLKNAEILKNSQARIEALYSPYKPPITQAITQALPPIPSPLIPKDLVNIIADYAMPDIGSAPLNPQLAHGARP